MIPAFLAGFVAGAAAALWWLGRDLRELVAPPIPDTEYDGEQWRW